MKYSDLMKKGTADLDKTLKEKRDALRSFRFNVSGSKATDVKAGRTLRREIARILTALRDKEKGDNV